MDVGYVSGIVGSQDSGSRSIIINSCYNAGTTISDGIIVFRANNTRTITNCYYLNTTRASSYATAKTVNEFRTLASTLGSTEWTDDVQDENGNWKYNNGYPILKWQVE